MSQAQWKVRWIKPWLILAGALLVLGSWSGRVVAQEGPVPRGRIHIDYAAHDSDKTPLSNGHRLRRARMGLSGKIEEDWAYKIEVDFAESALAFKDAYLQYRGFESGVLTQGNFKVPFGMDELTSSNDIPLIERSLPTTFALSRRMGIGYNMSGSSYTAALMAFGDEVGTHDDRVKNNVDEGFGVGGRATFDPVKSDAGLVHLGLALNVETPTGSRETEGDPDSKFIRVVRFRERPESRVSGERLVDTGDIDHVDNLNRIGLEAAWQAGPFLLQGEYITVQVMRGGGADDVAFDGYYVHGSYMLSGEQKGYRGGVFHGPALQPGSGAWEAAARYSHLDLNDGGIKGGEETNTTLGVNYYAVKHIRFMLNYILVDSKKAGVSDDPKILLFRTQVSF